LPYVEEENEVFLVPNVIVIDGRLDD